MVPLFIDHCCTSLLNRRLKIIRADLKEKKEKGNGLLPLVYPCVFYNGSEPYSHTTDIFELFEDPALARKIFLQPFQLIDLTQVPDEDLKKQPLLGTIQLLLKHAFTRDIIAFVQSISDLLKQAEKLKEFEILHESAHYLFQTNKDGVLRYDILNEFKKHLSPSTQKNIMTIAEAFVEEGRQEGLRKLLLRQIERRFPNQITSNQLQLIEQADSDDLALWGERLMDATSIAEIFI